MKSVKVYWRTNEQIRVPEVRLIGEDGKQVGVVTKDAALAQAKKAGLDLIEVAPLAKPPVVKIENFGKFRYREEKKLQKAKKGAKGSEVKEIRFSPFIAEHDFETRIERIEEFLADSNKARIVVVFKGRQMGSKDFGYNLLKKVLSRFEGKVSVDMEPKFLGRHLAMVISPLNRSVKSQEKPVSKEIKAEKVENKEEKNAETEN